MKNKQILEGRPPRRASKLGGMSIPRFGSARLTEVYGITKSQWGQLEAPTVWPGLSKDHTGSLLADQGNAHPVPGVKGSDPNRGWGQGVKTPPRTGARRTLSTHTGASVAGAAI